MPAGGSGGGLGGNVGGSAGGCGAGAGGMTLRLPLIVPAEACRPAVRAIALHSRSDYTSREHQPISESWRKQAEMKEARSSEVD